MARHTGDSGKITLDGTQVLLVTSFDVTDTSEIVDATAIDDGADVFLPSKGSWSGTVNFQIDWANGSGQDVSSGDQVAFVGYTEGDAVGKMALSGTAIVREVAYSTGLKTVSTGTLSLQGTGTKLSKAVVV